MQSDAEGPVQPLHDWWQAAATEQRQKIAKMQQQTLLTDLTTVFPYWMFSVSAATAIEAEAAEMHNH